MCVSFRYNDVLVIQKMHCFAFPLNAFIHYIDIAKPGVFFLFFLFYFINKVNLDALFFSIVMFYLPTINTLYLGVACEKEYRLLWMHYICQFHLRREITKYLEDHNDGENLKEIG